jgi:hypothetical protein
MYKVNEMETKTRIILLFAAVFAVAVIMGSFITGYFVKSVDYDDLCGDDMDCPENQCCVIYEEENLGLCMDECQSIEFLCTADSQCEVGTVCCISEGMKYGICNKEESCMSINLLSEYTEKKARLEKPAPIQYNKDMAILFETLVIIALIAIIIWLVKKKK